MATLYRPLPELLFSMGWFRRLSSNGKLVLITLAAGPCATGCPGLSVADPLTIVSLIGLEVPTVSDAFGELTRARAIEHDDEHRLVRLPWLPKMRATSSEKTLGGWYSCWEELPECELRQRHVESIREATGFHGKGVTERWAETFGLVEKPITRAQQALPMPMVSPTDGVDPEEETPSDHATQRNADADGTKPNEPHTHDARARVMGEARTVREFGDFWSERTKVLSYDAGQMREVRTRIGEWARLSGTDPRTAEDLALDAFERFVDSFSDRVGTSLTPQLFLRHWEKLQPIMSGHAKPPKKRQEATTAIGQRPDWSRE